MKCIAILVYRATLDLIYNGDWLSLVIQTGTVLRCHFCNLLVLGRVSPDDVEPVTRVIVHIIGTKLLGEVVESFVLPTEDISQNFTSDDETYQIRMFPLPS